MGINAWSLTFILSALFAADLGAAEFDATLKDPGAQVQLVVDRDALQAGAKTAKMTSMWWDAGAKPSLEYAAKQLDLLLDAKPAPAADLAAGLHSVDLAVYAAGADDPDPRLARFALMLRDVHAKDLAAAIVARIDRAAAGSVGPFTGGGNAQWAAGSVGSVLAFGDRKALAHLAEKGVSSADLSAQGPAWLTCDFAPTLEIAKLLEADGISYGLDPLLPKWRTEAPTMTLSAAPKGEEWTGTIDFKAANLPVHAIAPAIANLGTSSCHVRIAAGLEPTMVSGLFSNLMSVREDRELTQMLGMSIGEATGMFTGDVLLMVDASGLIPQGSVVLALKPGRDPSALIRNLANAFQGQAMDVPGASSAFLLDTKIGPWGIAYANDRLVFGNDQELGQKLLSGAAGNAPIPAGKALVVDLDLPLIGKQWLPLAYRLLGSARLEFGPDPARDLQFQLPDAMLALYQSKGAAAKTSQLLEGAKGITLTRGATVLPWTGFSEAFIAQAKKLVSGADLAKGLDERFAQYGDMGLVPVESTATVYRAADGYHVCEDD
nr:hypothetical protein [Planctomycetota bacterium]